MKKYGLQLRIPPAQQKQTASKPPLRPPAFAFKDDDDDEDDVEREISRQAAKTKALQKVEEQHTKALEENPSVFDYDALYSDMKAKIARRPRIQDKTERKSKYIEPLMQKAKEREREREIVYEKKLLKERSIDDHLYADKEKFVTSAYKKKLAEHEKWMEEERLRQIREEKEDITKKKYLSEFYFGLSKNVAFGGGGGDGPLVEPRKPSKPEVAVDNSAQGFDSGSATESNKVHRKSEAHYRSESQTEHEATASSQGRKREGNKDEEEKLNQTEEQSNETAEVYKRSEDAVAAARERFLARKRGRQQL